MTPPNTIPDVVIYIDQLEGNDAFDGSDESKPVLTIDQALELAKIAKIHGAKSILIMGIGKLAEQVKRECAERDADPQRWS